MNQRSRFQSCRFLSNLLRNEIRAAIEVSRNKRRKIDIHRRPSIRRRPSPEMIETIRYAISGKATRMQEPRKTITVDMLHHGERSSRMPRLYVNYIDIVSLARTVPLYSVSTPFVCSLSRLPRHIKCFFPPRVCIGILK